MAHRFGWMRAPRGRVGVAVLASLALVGAVAARPAAGKPSAPATFVVRVGGAIDNGVVQALGYYPAIVTIDAGDRVEWRMNSADPHSVLLPYGADLPTTHEILRPVGGSIFAGRGTESSGLLADGQSYSLVFAKPGIYLYESGVNPGMVGAVVVRPKGSPLPLTPAEAFSEGNHQMEDDLNAALAAEAAAGPPTFAGPHGTTVATVYADVAPPSDWIVPVASPNDTIQGTAQLTTEDPSTVAVAMDLTGLRPGEAYTAAIRFGAPVASAPLVGDLGTVTADRRGVAVATAVLKGMDGIPGRVSFLTLSTADGDTVAHAQITAPSFGVLSFLPANVTIHAGGSVVWTQNDPRELETVTLLQPGQNPPGYPGVRAETPSGGSVVSGPGFYNSGLLAGGQSYRLTFVKPGVYPYLSLVHAASPVAMSGSVVVLPRTRQ